MRSDKSEGGSPDHTHAPSAANQNGAVEPEATPLTHHNTLDDVDADLIRRSPEMRRVAEILARLAIRVALKRKRQHQAVRETSGKENADEPTTQKDAAPTG